MHLFYAPTIDSSSYMLDENEAKHCTRVLRLGNGDTVFLVDGKGGFYEGTLSVEGKRCQVNIQVQEKEKGKRRFRLHMAVAPTKNSDRFEWFLEKATEIGIDEVSPLLCERSERPRVKEERLNNVLISAMKQSLKAYLPQLHPLTKFAALLKIPFNGQKFIAHCGSGERAHLKEAYVPGSDCMILIGPEGDFSEAEVKLALEHGFRAIQFGESRLRTETAALAACLAVNMLSE